MVIQTAHLQLRPKDNKTNNSKASPTQTQFSQDSNLTQTAQSETNTPYHTDQASSKTKPK